MKKITGLILIFSMLVSLTFTAEASNMTVTEKQMADGVVHSVYTLRTSAGKQKADVLKVELDNPRVGIKMLTDPEGVSYLESVKNMASADERVIAAVNADFFAWYSKDKSRGSAVGLNVVDGQVMSSAPAEEELASLVFTTGGAVLTQYFKPRMSVTNEDGRTEEIGTINKFDSLAKIAMYTSPWGKSLTCDGGNQRIAVVEGDKVTEIVSEEGEVLIPEEGYLLAGLADHTDFFSEGIEVGSKLKCELYFDPYFDDIDMAVGGGTVLVKNGYAADITHMRFGRDFRTAAGVSKDGETLYLITVDKNNTSIGMTLQELRSFMLEIGVFDGLNLDGGGSTQMVGRGYGDSKIALMNSPENGYSRPVVNALAITVKGGERGEFYGVAVKTNAESVIIGETVTASFIPYDELYYPLEPDDDAKYTFKGVSGKQKGNTFTPDETGILTVTVNYNGEKAKTTVEVIDPDKYMNADSPVYRAKSGEKVDVKVNAVTLSGKLREVPLEDIDITISGGIATLSDGVITAEKPGFGSITFTCGEFTFSSYLSVDGVLPDDAYAEPTAVSEDFEEKNAYALSYPTDTPSAYAISSEEVKDGKKSGKLWFDFDTGITDLQSAYAVFDTPYEITRSGAELSVDVFSPGFEKALLKAMLTDREGNVHRISLGNLAQEGWHNYAVTLPAGIALPAKLTRLYVVEGEAESAERGAIYFDNLTLTAGGTGDFETDTMRAEVSRPSVVLTGGITATQTLLPTIAALKVNKELSSATASYSFKPLVSADNAVKTEKGKVTVSGNVTMVQYLDAEHLSGVFEDSEQAVVIVTDNPSAVKKALSDITGEYSEKDIFVVSEGKAPLVEISDGVRYITLPALAPSLLTNQKTFVTLEIGALKSKTVYNIKRIKLWE